MPSLNQSLERYLGYRPVFSYSFSRPETGKEINFSAAVLTLLNPYFCIMIQQILVILIFAAALFYLGRLLYKSFQAKSAGCATGCGKCGAVDFDKIEAQIKSKGLS